MTEPEPQPAESVPAQLILSKATARRRFLLYLALKLGGLAMLFGGVFLGRGGLTPVSGLLMLAGMATLFVRPRMLGLTTRPDVNPDGPA